MSKISLRRGDWLARTSLAVADSEFPQFSANERRSVGYFSVVDAAVPEAAARPVDEEVDGDHLEAIMENAWAFCKDKYAMTKTVVELSRILMKKSNIRIMSRTRSKSFPTEIHGRSACDVDSQRISNLMMSKVMGDFETRMWFAYFAWPSSLRSCSQASRSHRHSQTTHRPSHRTSSCIGGNFESMGFILSDGCHIARQASFQCVHTLGDGVCRSCRDRVEL